MKTGTVGGVTPDRHASAVKAGRELRQLLAKKKTTQEVVKWKKQSS